MNSKKLLLLSTIIFLIIFSCKKNTDTTPPVIDPPDPSQVETYLSDTTIDFPTGVLKPTLDELQTVPLLDTSTLSVFGINEKAMSLDPAYDLSSGVPGMPPPGDQNHLNNCAAWAVTYGMMGYLYGIRGGYTDYKADDKKFSPPFVYNQVIKQPRYNGLDNGILLKDALSFVKDKGCSKWTDMSPIAIATKPPTDAAVTNALNYKITDYSRVGNVDIDFIKSVISKFKRPLVFSCYVGDGFMHQGTLSWVIREGDRKVWKPLIYTTLGLKTHAMVIVGYDDAISAFKVQNSWKFESGTPWGPWAEGDSKNDGYCWIDYDQFKKAIYKEPAGGLDNPDIYVAILTPPTISTIPPTNITSTTANTGGNITSNGNNLVIDRGICWGTVLNPTITSNHSSNGSDIGSFENTITSLNPGTTYHVRAYATSGAGTAYAKDVSFTTSVSTGTDTVHDANGNVYHTKTIGRQVWMVENLRVSSYNDFTPIPQVTDAFQWSGLTTGAWCNYNNDPSNDATYGKLYNRYTVAHGNLSPIGWRVATSSDFAELADSLGGLNAAGREMKSTSLWTAVGTNSSGFNAVPAGFRDYYNGSFSGLTQACYWWVPGSFLDASTGFAYGLDFSDRLYSDPLGEYSASGFSIRCIKE